MHAAAARCARPRSSANGRSDRAAQRRACRGHRHRAAQRYSAARVQRPAVAWLTADGLFVFLASSSRLLSAVSLLAAPRPRTAGATWAPPGPHTPPNVLARSAGRGRPRPGQGRPGLGRTRQDLPSPLASLSPAGTRLMRWHRPDRATGRPEATLLALGDPEHDPMGVANVTAKQS